MAAALTRTMGESIVIIQWGAKIGIGDLTMMKFISGFIVLTVLAVLPGSGDAQERAITQIAGDLYRFQNNGHYSVFLVTPEGVIATDPINSGAAKWLKNEIKARFNQPIKYVIYSHDHADHISGGEVFADDGAIVVAHTIAKACAPSAPLGQFRVIA